MQREAALRVCAAISAVLASGSLRHLDVVVARIRFDLRYWKRRSTAALYRRGGSPGSPGGPRWVCVEGVHDSGHRTAKGQCVSGV